MPPARFDRFGRGVCGVNVKLTMRLAFYRQPVMSAHSIASKATLQGRRGTQSQGGCKQVWSSRGEGLGYAREKTGPVKGRASQALPFSLQVGSATLSRMGADDLPRIGATRPHVARWRRSCETGPGGADGWRRAAPRPGQPSAPLRRLAKPLIGAHRSLEPLVLGLFPWNPRQNCRPIRRANRS
jgi:hypothetical protein